MYVYIDESGGFIPLAGDHSRISAVAALVIPRAAHDRLLRQFRILPGVGPAHNDAEVKGSTQGPDQLRAIADFLARYDVLGEAVLVDMGELSGEQVEAFQRQQATIIERSIPDHASDELRSEIHALSELTLRLSPQTFVQAYLTVALIDKTFRIATAYFAQRDARELARFDWFIDAKDRTITASEQFWRELLFPALVAKSEVDPVGFIPWGNYEHLALDPHGPRGPGRDIPINMTQVMEHTVFAHSHEQLGLQLADFFASAVSRSFNNSLDQEGWLPFGHLLVHRNPGANVPEALQMITLRTSSEQPKRLSKSGYHGWVMERFRTATKPMVPPWHRHHMKDVR